MPRLMVRYGELGLKSPAVRRRFENALIEDIRHRHLLARVPCVVSSTRGRVFVDSDDWRKSCEILSKTFGVVSFSPVAEVESELSALTAAVLEFSEPLLYAGAKFAVRARRTGTHAYTSRTLAEHLGSEILKRFEGLGIGVSLEDPDVEVSVEVREDKAYLFSSVIAGPGGMPSGTQGRLLSVASTERGVASSWLMMKRGCTVLVSTHDEHVVSPLHIWCPNLRILPASEDPFALARENACLGLAFESSLHDIEHGGASKGDLPVFYPLVGMTDEQVDALVSRIRS